LKLRIITWIVLAVNLANVYSQDLVADNMLMFQRNYGGWPKHLGNDKIDYTKTYSVAEKAAIADDAGTNDATIDNDATTKEIKYLISAYKKSNNKKYLDAAERGIRYLLKAQYANGGWPQFYPDTSLYRTEVTYNDNAMTNVMNVLYDVSNKLNDMEIVDASLREPSKKAVEKGIDCILKTQIKVDGKLTVWCAQYDCKTLQPAKARSYELPSLSGEESVDIVLFLMRMPNPSNEIKKSISSAVDWFKKSEIKGLNWINVKDDSAPKKFDRVAVKDDTSTIWARFYDIDTNEPFFCGRDGIKKKTVAGIEYERRTGYAWYGRWPKELIDKKYPEWVAKNK
jgi:PelA/Pel-15E family pectate lyase